LAAQMALVPRPQVPAAELGSIWMLEIRNAVLNDMDALTAVFVACFNDAPWNDVALRLSLLSRSRSHSE
jgi:hypothetical protein